MRKLFYLIVIFISIFFNTLKAEQIKSIEVIGNKRISKQTILVFGDIKIDNKINNKQDLNNILKNLYETKLFFKMLT